MAALLRDLAVGPAVAVEDGVLGGRLLPAPDRDVDECRADLHGAAAAPEPLGRDQLAAAARKRFEHEVAAAGVQLHRDLEKAQRFLRGVLVADDALFPLPVDLPDCVELADTVVGL